MVAGWGRVGGGGGEDAEGGGWVDEGGGDGHEWLRPYGGEVGLFLLEDQGRRAQGSGIGLLLLLEDRGSRSSRSRGEDGNGGAWAFGGH